MAADTRQRILDTARRLFNEQGLASVGVRDIARATSMSAGNLAYHFPQKDDLVATLRLELHDLNRSTVFAGMPKDLSLEMLYLAACTALRNMLPYRFVLLSPIEALRASPRLFELERSLARQRRRRHDVMLARLMKNGWIEPDTAARSGVIYEQSSMISSGWLTVAAVRGWSDERAVRHFAKLGCALLEPHCTPPGERQMRRVLDGALDQE